MAAKKAAKKASAKKTSRPSAAEKRAAAAREVEDNEDLDIDEVEDAPVGEVRGADDDDEDMEPDAEPPRPDTRTPSKRLAQLDEEAEAQAEVGVTTRTTTEKNALRERKLRDLLDDGTVERNRTITGSQGRGRSVPTKADKKAKDKPRAKFKVTATRLGYFDLERRRPGDTFYMEMEIGEGDEPVHMPTWVVLAKDYIPEDEDVAPAKRRTAPDVIKL